MTGQNFHYRRRRIGLSLISALVTEIISKLSPLLVLFIAQQRLGVVDFGKSQHALATIETLVPMIAFGYAPIAAISIGMNLHKNDVVGGLIADVLSLKLLHLLMISLIGILFLLVNRSVDTPALFFAAGILLLASSLDTDFVHFGSQSMLARNLFAMFAKVIGVIGVLLFVRDPNDALIYTGVSALPALCLSIISAFYNIRRFTFRRPNVIRMRQLFIGAASFGLMGFTFTLLDRFDVLMVDHLFGAEITGIYSGQMRLVQSVSTAASSIGLIFYSEMFAEHDPKNFSNLAAKSLWAMTVIVAPIACGVWFVKEEILQLMYGFTTYSAILGLLTLSSLFLVFIQVFGNQVLLIKRQVAQYNKYMILAILTGCLVGLSLEEIYGPYAMAIGNVTAKVVATIFFVRMANQYLVEFPWSNLLRILVPCASMTIILLLLPKMNLWFTAVTGAILYATSLSVFNFQQIKQFYSKMKDS